MDLNFLSVFSDPCPLPQIHTLRSVIRRRYRSVGPRCSWCVASARSWLRPIPWSATDGGTKLRCDGCGRAGKLLELRSTGTAAHARRASRACSATRVSSSDSSRIWEELKRAASSNGGEQQADGGDNGGADQSLPVGLWRGE
jgi:hypothetical protein